MTAKKTSTAKIIVITAALCLTIIHSKDAFGSEWKLYSENKHFYFYYTEGEPDSLKEILNIFKKRIVRVWTKRAVKNDEGRDRQIRENREIGLSVKDYEHYEYTLAMKEMNCSDKTIRAISEADYTKEGNLLAKSESPFSAWNPVVPASGDESLYKEVCTFPEAEKR